MEEAFEQQPAAEGGNPKVLVDGHQIPSRKADGRLVRGVLAFEQQPRETAKAFAAFSVYLNLGSERSLEAVRVRCGKSSRLIQRWSSRWRWGERVEAHAAYLATVEREATAVVARGTAAERVKRQQAILEEEWTMHEECIRVGREALTRFYEKGKGATLGDIARMFAEGSRLGRLASGLATDKTELTGEDGGAIRVDFEAALRKVYARRAVLEVEEIRSPKSEVRSEEQKRLLKSGKRESGKAESEDGGPKSGNRESGKAESEGGQ